MSGGNGDIKACWTEACTERREGMEGWRARKSYKKKTKKKKTQMNTITSAQV